MKLRARFPSCILITTTVEIIIIVILILVTWLQLLLLVPLLDVIEIEILQGHRKLMVLLKHSRGCKTWHLLVDGHRNRSLGRGCMHHDDLSLTSVKLRMHWWCSDPNSQIMICVLKDRSALRWLAPSYLLRRKNDLRLLPRGEESSGTLSCCLLLISLGVTHSAFSWINWSFVKSNFNKLI